MRERKKERANGLVSFLVVAGIASTLLLWSVYTKRGNRGNIGNIRNLSGLTVDVCGENRQPPSKKQRERAEAVLEAFRQEGKYGGEATKRTNEQLGEVFRVIKGSCPKTPPEGVA